MNRRSFFSALAAAPVVGIQQALAASKPAETAATAVTLLDKINILCASDFENPDMVAYGYRFFFRKYFQSVNSDHITGIALAWPDVGVPLGDRRYFYWTAGVNSHGSEYMPGWQFNTSGIPSGLDLRRPDAREYFQKLKTSALYKLFLLVREESGYGAPGLTGSVAERDGEIVIKF